MEHFHDVLGNLAAGVDTPALRRFLVAAYVRKAMAVICNLL
jgi:hypothetical protein